MNLTLIRDFFTCQANVQDTRIKKIKSFLSSYPRIGMFSLFKQLTFASVPQLNEIHFKKYMAQFTSNLHSIQPNQINQLSSCKSVTNRKSLSQDEILQKGINLFLKTWGNSSKQFSYSEFSKFMKDDQKLPQKATQIPYPAKKKLFQIIQTQIQGLLNIQTLRQICIKQYKNITDLFQNLASYESHKIDRNSLQNLYLMSSIRMDDQFYDQIQRRLKLPLDFENFLQIFKKDASQQNKKLKQRKIYFSSVKRKKDHVLSDYLQDQSSNIMQNSRNSINFNTPKTHKVANNRHLTSTKITKGQKINQLKQASVSVSKFNANQQQHFYGQPKQIQILGEILAIEEAFIQLKRNLCYRKDFDLQLVYERQGYKFENLLNQVYGACNFTSFVRFIVPQDFQHKYLAYVRYESSNVLSNQTVQMIDDLLQAYDRKQTQIQAHWQKIDRQIMFRMYCRPCDKGIKGQQLMKYFTQRQSKVLLDRMDPYKTGEISFQNFK